MKPETQQLIADPLASEWYGAPLIWGLSFVDFGVLLGIGVLVSAAVWFVVETAKIRGKLLTSRQREVAPILLCMLIAPWLFPLSVQGLAAPSPVPLPTWAAVLMGVGLAVVGGKGAQGAHNRAEALMQAVFGWVLDKLRPKDGGRGGN